MTTSGLRRPVQSLITPEITFTNEVVASAMPSINLTEAVVTPRDFTRNTGRSP
jgi:hypothetical protein